MPSSTTPGRRTRMRAADRQASIVAAATEVFAESGYQRATMAEVAARLGITEPVVFNNFGTKAGLYAAVVADASARMCELLGHAAERAPSVAGLLRELLGPGHLDELHAPGSLGVIFADAMTLTAEPAVEQAVREHLGRLAGTLADLAARGQREGGLRADVDPGAVAWWLLSFLAAHGFRSAVLPDRAQLESTLAGLTLEAILTDSR